MAITDVHTLCTSNGSEVTSMPKAEKATAETGLLDLIEST